MACTMASTSDVQSGHSGYPPIDVKGEIDRLLFVLPTGINYASFYPIVMRNHDEGADHKWITIRWGQGQVEILQKAAELLTSGSSLGHLEKKIVLGFMYNMSNARGREMISSLFEKLCPICTVTSMGGGATTDPAVRQIFFIPIDYTSSSPESSPEKTELSPKRKRDEDARPIKKPKRFKKHFVPDMVAEIIDVKCQISRELFNVSLKSGHYVRDKDHCQLKYELLPVVMKEKVALGLLICAGEAFLYRLVLADNCVTCQCRSYNVGNDKLCESVSQICEDVAYYVNCQIKGYRC